MIPGARDCIALPAYLCQTGKVDQRQIQDMGRVDFEIDRLTRDALVVTSDAGRLVFDFALDIAKIGEAAIGDMIELCPLSWSRDIRVPI